MSLNDMVFFQCSYPLWSFNVFQYIEIRSSKYEVLDFIQVAILTLFSYYVSAYS